MNFFDYVAALRESYEKKRESYEKERLIWQAKEKVREFDEKKERERRRKDFFCYVSMDDVPPSQKMDENNKFKKLFDNGCLKCTLPFRNGEYCAKWELERNEVCKEILAKFYDPYDDYDEFF